jgi:hypothetical protein
MRQKIEVDIQSLNGNPFRGSISQMGPSTKSIKGDYESFSNFDGMRFEYRSCTYQAQRGCECG